MSAQPGYDTTTLWEILAETVRALPMYRYHKRYVERSILPEKPQISAKELSLLMGIPLGEAIIIMGELRSPSKTLAATGIEGKPVVGKSLLDYSNG